jgi:hypothetical protein
MNAQRARDMADEFNGVITRYNEIIKRIKMASKQGKYSIDVSKHDKNYQKIKKRLLDDGYRVEPHASYPTYKVLW